ncbi:MAG: universal stress protein [Myxococcales bacterium]|nr:universal stress protein [Myxococcales bacterium]
MFDKILVAFDGSEASTRAFATALDLAQKYQAVLLLVSVIEDLPRYAEESMNGVDEMLEQGKQHFADLQQGLIAKAQNAGLGIAAHVLPGHVIETVVGIAEQEKADLIVLGGQGRTGTFRRVASLTGVQIAHHAPCAVLIMR